MPEAMNAATLNPGRQETPEDRQARIERTYPIFNPDDKRGNTIKSMYRTLHAAIEAECPASRERSLALTDLENSAMWAVKSVHANKKAA